MKITEFGDGARTIFLLPPHDQRATVKVNGVAATIASQASSTVTLAAPPPVGATVEIDFTPASSNVLSTAPRYPRAGNKVVLFGSSSYQYNNERPGVGGVTTRLVNWARGAFTWTNALMGQRLNLVRNSGVSGNGFAEMEERFSRDVLTYQPDWVWITAGMNDIYMLGMSGNEAFERCRAMCEQALAAGIRVGLRIPHNWSSTDQYFTTDKAGQYFEYIRQLREYASITSNVVAFDVPSVIVDPATGQAKANALFDTKHLSNYGAMLEGQLISQVLAPMIPPIESRVFSNSESSAYSAGISQLLSDPLMLTGGGTLGTGITGTAWQNLSIARQTGTPSATASLVAAPGGIGQGQRLQITATAANDRINAIVDSSKVLPQLAPGDRVVLEARLSIAAGSSGLRAFPLYFQQNDAFTIGDMTRDTTTPANDKPLPGTALELTLRTPVYVIPAGVTKLEATISFLFSGAGTADVTVSQMQVRKVSSMLPTIY